MPEGRMYRTTLPSGRLYSLLLSGLSDIAQSLLAFFCNVCPVFSCYLILREQLGTHTYAEHTGLDPGSKILLSRLYTAGYHQLGPRHRSQHALNKLRSQYVARENLAQVATYFLGETYLGHAAATRRIGHQTTVTNLSNLGIVQRTYHKLAPS